jgi:hypothetical protein
MMHLLANAETSSRTFYEFAPLLPISVWWHLLLALLCGLVAIAFVVFMNLVDSAELPLPLRIVLTFLRLAAVIAIGYYFLNLEKRSEQRVVRNSRVAVLVDTSLSMGLTDTQMTSGSSSNVSRLDEIHQWLEKSDFVENLRSNHDVVVYQFGEEALASEIAAFDKRPQPSEADSANSDPTNQSTLAATARASDLRDFARSRSLFQVGAGILALALLLSLLAGVIKLVNRATSFAGWAFATAVITIMLAIIMLATSDLVCLKANFWETVGLQKFNPVEVKQNELNTEEKPVEPEIDWASKLQATGAATRMNDAIRFVVNKEREGPIAGIVLISDGRNNMGADDAVSLATVRDAGIPLFTIGAGSNESPRNIRVADVKAPKLVFPGDPFTLTGLIQSFGFADQQVQIELYSVDKEQTEAETLEAQATFTTPADGTPEPISFELSSDEKGKRIYRLQISPPEGDSVDSDNAGTIEIEFIDRKQNVLLVGGGPTRDYRFLRNQLYRDAQVISHVYLQSAGPGADQEGSETLLEFPKTREQWFSYDCIVAFDPDWTKLTAQQAQWLEQWIAEKAGGMIVIAGPVNTPLWTRRPRGDETIDIIRRLYPVSFYNQSTSVVKLGRFGGDKPFPLEFSREGRAAEFLWLAETGSASQDVWSDSKGVFGYYSVSEAKAGAEVYARFSDRNASIGGELPIYFASQFYGSGRVFFQASGEMWRMRALDPKYFEQYYTKLIRWVSQGRLSRDSSRGVLLVSKENVWIGDQVTVQAILRDAQDRPLNLPSVTAVVISPGGATATLELNRLDDGTDSGTFSGQITTKMAGDYRISLPIPDSPDAEVLSVELNASISDLEISKPQRNDASLSTLATQTGGKYFPHASDATSGAPPEQLASLIDPRDQETFLPGTTDREFTRRSMMWLLGFLTLAFCLEWIIRRLNRLA